MARKNLGTTGAQVLAGAPVSPVAGQFYLSSADKRLYYWDGTAWVMAGGGQTAANLVTTDTAQDVVAAKTFRGDAALRARPATSGGVSQEWLNDAGGQVARINGFGNLDANQVSAPYIYEANGSRVYSASNPPPAPANMVDRTLVDVRGDLLVGSGADTVGRLAPGADGLVLVTRANATLGVQWEQTPLHPDALTHNTAQAVTGAKTFSTGTLLGADLQAASGGSLALRAADGTVRQRVDPAGVTLFTTAAISGGGVGVLGVADAATLPSSNPVGGALLYSNAGRLHVRQADGTTFPLAPAAANLVTTDTTQTITGAKTFRDVVVMPPDSNRTALWVQGVTNQAGATMVLARATGQAAALLEARDTDNSTVLGSVGSDGLFRERGTRLYSPNNPPPAPGNMLTTDTTQTVTGTKTFQAASDVAVLNAQARAGQTAAVIRILDDAGSERVGIYPSGAISSQSSITGLGAHRLTTSVATTVPLTAGSTNTAPTADLFRVLRGTDTAVRVGPEGYIYEGTNRVYSAANPPPASASAAPANMVTTDTTQAISGHKEFAGGLGLAGEYPSGNPGVPTAGVDLFARINSGRRMPAAVGPTGLDYALQPFWGTNKIGVYSAVGNGTGITQLGLSVTSVGSAVVRNVESANLFRSIRRIGLQTTTTAGTAIGYRQALVNFFYSSTAGLGGFHFLTRCGIATFTAGQRFFVGMHANTNQIAGTADPSTLLNLIGFGCNAGQTTMRVFANNASGTASMVDLGPNFPLNTSSVDVYEFGIFAPPGSTVVRYRVARLNTGDVAEGTFDAAKQPAANTMLAPHIHHTNGTTAAVAALDFSFMYIETDN